MATDIITWSQILGIEKQKPYFKGILEQVAREQRDGKIIFPPKTHIFRAFELTAYADIKVVILGQDPYHGENQAHGLSFSVQKPVPKPPSLQNIFKEIEQDLGLPAPDHGDLTGWAQQGVLLLNASLTVQAGTPQSHAKLGWQTFTDHVIACVNDHPEPVVFLLWGASAQRKADLLDAKRHLILTAPHPSPLSCHRGFLGCRHFSQANAFLKKNHRSPIEWGDLP